MLVGCKLKQTNKTDFGLAFKSLSKTGVRGTRAFMAPEVEMKSLCTWQSDMWSIGAAILDLQNSLPEEVGRSDYHENIQKYASYQKYMKADD